MKLVSYDARPESEGYCRRGSPDKASSGPPGRTYDGERAVVTPPKGLGAAWMRNQDRFAGESARMWAASRLRPLRDLIEKPSPATWCAAKRIQSLEPISAPGLWTWPFRRGPDHFVGSGCPGSRGRATRPCRRTKTRCPPAWYYAHRWLSDHRTQVHPGARSIDQRGVIGVRGIQAQECDPTARSASYGVRTPQQIRPTRCGRGPPGPARGRPPERCRRRGGTRRGCARCWRGTPGGCAGRWSAAAGQVPCDVWSATHRTS